MSYFRDQIDKINAKAAKCNLPAILLEQAWTEAYQSMNFQGAYHLDENGFHFGDAEICDIAADAVNLGLDYTIDDDIGIYDFDDAELALMEIINDNFINIYEVIISKLIIDFFTEDDVQ